MSTKGESKRTKARSMPKQIMVSKKENYWIVRTKAGPHSKDTSMPLAVVVRNLTGLALTLKEAKGILNRGDVKVNGVVRTSHQFPVGLFDVISFAKQNQYFRVLFDSKGRLIVKQTEKESKEKISKVTAKKMLGKEVQITTNDGRTFTGIKANVGDSVKIKLPEGKCEEVIEFRQGATAYVIKGAQCAQTATVKEVVEGTARRKKLVKLEKGKEAFETIAENIFIIGKGKSAMAEVE